MTIIVDYGVGNLGSVLNMLKRIGADAKISSSSVDIKSADKLILPGVGAFDSAMNKLYGRQVLDDLAEAALVKKTPLLGICLGAQLLTKSSEEGTLPGLGWIDAEVVKFQFPPDTSLKVPHLGWNEVQPVRQNEILPMNESHRYYFVHSFHIVCHKDADIIGKSEYGHQFTCAFNHGNLFGVQFHPEKSHIFGMKLLERFNKL